MKRLTTEEFVKNANAVHNNYYSYDKTVYTKAIDKVIITCPLHGDFHQRPNDHISGKNGCPNCKFSKISTLKRKDITDVLGAFNTVHEDRYCYDEVKYVNTHTHVKIKCPTHGVFLMTPSKHLSGNGCPSCGASNGERLVSSVLQEIGTNYIRQHTFSDLMGDYNHLKFDFFLPDLNMLIEYDGEQHFFHNKIFNYKSMEESEAIEKFLKIKEYDALKNTYAIRNKIFLLRIPYFYRTKRQIRAIILHSIKHCKPPIQEFDDSFSYVEMPVPIR